MFKTQAQCSRCLADPSCLFALFGKDYWCLAFPLFVFFAYIERPTDSSYYILLLKVPKAKILLPSRALITEAAAILDKTRVRLPESQHSVDAETAWSTWMEQELSSKLRGLTAGTVRAQVRIVNVRSAEVHKGMIRYGYIFGNSIIYNYIPFQSQ